MFLKRSLQVKAFKNYRARARQTYRNTEATERKPAAFAGGNYREVNVLFELEHSGLAL